MEIAEVKQKKEELGVEIVKLLNGFSEETGLRVEQIKVINIRRAVYLDKIVYVHSVVLRVEV